MQRLDLFLVLVERRVGIDLDLDLAVGVFLGELLKFERAFSLRRVIGYDVTEFDDDLALGRGGRWNHQNGGRNRRKNKIAHEHPL